MLKIDDKNKWHVLYVNYEIMHRIMHYFISKHRRCHAHRRCQKNKHRIAPSVRCDSPKLTPTVTPHRYTVGVIAPPGHPNFHYKNSSYRRNWKSAIWWRWFEKYNENSNPKFSNSDGNRWSWCYCWKQYHRNNEWKKQTNGTKWTKLNGKSVF